MIGRLVRLSTPIRVFLIATGVASPATRSSLYRSRKEWGLLTLNAEQRKSLEKATTAYADQLTESPAGLSYLNGRGIDIETARSYRLGYVATPEPGHDQFVGMISIPYDRMAGTLGIKFRRLDDAKPKYLNTPGIGTHLYNAPVLLHAGLRVGICEGEFDTITLGLCGVSAVGIPGVTHWKAHPEWVRLLDGREVLIFPDNDLANGNPGEKLANEIITSIPTARIVRLPEPEGDDTKMDVNTCYLRYGSAEIRKRAGL